MNNVSGNDLLTLLVLALPVAAIAWAVTHEELFGEFHDFCVGRSENARRFAVRKFFYLFTCEYCFSHYVSAGVLVVTRFRLLFDDWRGYVIAWFALVWVANHLIGIYGRLRLVIRSERLEIGLKEAVSERVGGAKLEDRGPKTERKAG
ncbi:MAG: hypothetical protein ABIS29_06000 [Vicinamibacterales bacterium]